MSDNLAHAVAGAAGGVVSTCFTYPLITISSRLQVQKDDKSGDAYKNTWDGIQKILQKEGFSGLFSGIHSALFGIAVTNGVYYYWYEMARDLFLKTSNRKMMSTLESMLAGAVAGAATVVITNPIWVINTRMIVKKDSLDDKSGTKPATATSSSLSTSSSSSTAPSTAPAPRSAWAVFLKTVKEDGVASLWQGLVPALILVINPIIQYTVFEQTKGSLTKWRHRHGGKLLALDIFFLGAISKLAATSITYPYLVVKARMQLRQSKSEDSRYASVLDGFRKIIQQEGMPGLYKGIESKLVQSVLTAALLFTAKEQLFASSVRLLALLGVRKHSVTVETK